MSMPEEVQSRNRLTIAHLLLWMLGSAIILACYRALTLNEQRPEEPLGTVWSVSAICYSLLAGVQVGSLFLLAWRVGHRTGGFPTQPGHWLLVIEGVSGVLVWIGYVASLLVEVHPLFSWPLPQIPNCVASAMLYAIGFAIQSRDSRLWKAAFVLMIVQYSFAAFFYFALLARLLLTRLSPSDLAGDFHQLQGLCFWPAIVVVLLVASYTDPRRMERDFLHWTGIAALVGTSVLQFSLSFLVSYFLD